VSELPPDHQRRRSVETKTPFFLARIVASLVGTCYCEGEFDDEANQWYAAFIAYKPYAAYAFRTMVDERVSHRGYPKVKWMVH
jgi:hypothetical protein